MSPFFTQFWKELPLWAESVSITVPGIFSAMNMM